MADSCEHDRVVVIAMDGSKHSDFAFNWYMDNVYRKGDHVILVHCPEFHTIVAAPMPAADAVMFTQMYQEEEKKVHEFVEKLGQKLKDHAIGGRVISRRGSPGDAVCDVAKEHKANLIVSGTRGQGKIRRTLLGSVSDYILHHSHVPVLIAKDKHHDHMDSLKE